MVGTKAVLFTPTQRPPASWELWVRRLCWGIVALSCLQILLFSYGRDQGIYAVVADSMLHGKVPYRDAWDFKPPGIFFVFALAQALFGKAMVSIRLVEMAGVVATVFGFRALGRETLGDDLAGLMGGALFALVYAQLEFWHTAQPESFGGMLTVFALVLTLSAAETQQPSRRAVAWVGMGALFGAAFVLKPPLGGGAIVCAAHLGRVEFARTRRVGRALAPVCVAAASSLAVVLATALWFWARGGWPALRWTLFDFTPGYTALGWQDRTPLGLFLYALEEMAINFSYVVPVGVLAAVALPPIHGREREALFLTFGIVSVHAAGIALQAKFFQYHYAASIPLLAFIAGLGLYKLLRRALRFGRAATAAFAGVLVALVLSRVALRHNPGTYWERSFDRMKYLVLRNPSRAALDGKLYRVADYDLGADRRAANVLAGLVAPNEPIFVWGFEPVIYWLSGRPPATRYLYDVPQRSSWLRDHARRVLLDDLARTPPRAIVVQHGDSFSFVTGDDLDSAESLATFPALDRIITDQFRFVESVDRLDVYVRR